MTVTARPLFTAQYAPNAQTTVYTVNAGRTIIDKFTAYNSDAGTQTLSVNLVPNGASASASNLVEVKALASGETYTFPEIVGHVLETGGAVSLVASVASKIVIRASGREVT